MIAGLEQLVDVALCACTGLGKVLLVWATVDFARGNAHYATYAEKLRTPHATGAPVDGD